MKIILKELEFTDASRLTHDHINDELQQDHLQRI